MVLNSCVEPYLHFVHKTGPMYIYIGLSAPPFGTTSADKADGVAQSLVAERRDRHPVISYYHLKLELEAPPPRPHAPPSEGGLPVVVPERFLLDSVRRRTKPMSFEDSSSLESLTEL